MGICRYVYNPSELYQRTAPGQGVESCCGAVTWPAQDEPEMIPAVDANGIAVLVATGRIVNREHDDPYCPDHGGTPEPPLQALTLTELQQARALYASLLARFQATGSLPPGVDPSTWAEIQAVGRRLIELDVASPQAIETNKEPG